MFSFFLFATKLVVDEEESREYYWPIFDKVEKGKGRKLERFGSKK